MQIPKIYKLNDTSTANTHSQNDILKGLAKSL